MKNISCCTIAHDSRIRHGLRCGGATILMTALCILQTSCIIADQRDRTQPTVSSAGTQEAAADDRVAIFTEICDLVAANFYDADAAGDYWTALCTEYRARALAASTQQQFSQVVNNLLSRLNTSHTSYYTPQQREYYELLAIYRMGDHPNLQGMFDDGIVRWESIGIISQHTAAGVLVREVHPHAPAANAGLRMGDRIVRIDDSPGFHPVLSLRGRAGQTVVITVERGDTFDESHELEVDVQWIDPARQFVEIVQHSARIYELHDRKVGYIRIFAYTSPRIHDAVVELVNEDLAEADALVLDLRGGWGGANPDYLDLFHTNAPQISFITRDGWEIDVDRKWRKPLVLLIDAGTRSGKEILAHAVRENNLGLLVGQRTAGAVVGGRPFVLRDGSLLVLATSDVRINGERLEGIGVEPHVTVPFDVRTAAGGDQQLERAIAEAARLAH